MSVDSDAPGLDRGQESTDQESSDGDFEVVQRSLSGGRASGQITLSGDLVSPISERTTAGPPGYPDLSRPSNKGSGECTRSPHAVDGLPDHVRPCTCPEHDGYCDECGFKITVAPSGRELGHARENNRSPESEGERRDCPHRDPACDPRGRG